MAQPTAHCCSLYSHIPLACLIKNNITTRSSQLLIISHHPFQIMALSSCHRIVDIQMSDPLSTFTPVFVPKSKWSYNYTIVTIVITFLFTTKAVVLVLNVVWYTETLLMFEAYIYAIIQHQKAPVLICVWQCPFLLMKKDCTPFMGCFLSFSLQHFRHDSIYLFYICLRIRKWDADSQRGSRLTGGNLNQSCHTTCITVTSWHRPRGCSGHWAHPLCLFLPSCGSISLFLHL